MKYVERVKSPLKGGVDVRLGPRTVLVGPNGAGKTAVIQAIELAVLGEVTDVEGRDHASRSSVLARLFPEGGPYTSYIRWSDGSEHEWRMEPRSGGFKKPERVSNPFSVSFPVRDLKSTLSSANDTVRAWMESNIQTEVSEADVLRSVGPVHSDATEKLIKATGCSDFLKLAKEGKSRSRSLKLKATAKEKTVEEMSANMATPLLDAERSEIEERLVKLKGETGASREEYDRMCALRDELRAALAATQARVSKLEAALASLPGGKESGRLEDVLGHLKQHVALSQGDRCLVCGTEGVSSTVQARLEAVERSLEAHEKVRKVQHALDSSRTDMARIEQELGSAEEAVRRIDAQGGPSEDHTEEIRDLEAKLSKDEMARQSWDNAHRTRTKIASLRQQADKYSAASKKLSELGRKLLERRKARFTEEVSKRLAFDDVFDVDFSTSRVGIKRDGRLHTALSGVEESRVLLALSADHEGPAILIPPDRAWDAGTLTATMQKLHNVQSQVIIMSTVRPDPVDGWKILDI